jgi:hypothetical protein
MPRRLVGGVAALALAMSAIGCAARQPGPGAMAPDVQRAASVVPASLVAPAPAITPDAADAETSLDAVEPWMNTPADLAPPEPFDPVWQRRALLRADLAVALQLQRSRVRYLTEQWKATSHEETRWLNDPRPAGSGAVDWERQFRHLCRLQRRLQAELETALNQLERLESLQRQLRTGGPLPAGR